MSELNHGANLEMAKLNRREWLLRTSVKGYV